MYSLIDPIITTSAVNAPESPTPAGRDAQETGRAFSRSLLTNGPLLLGDVLLLTAGLLTSFLLTLFATKAGHDNGQLVNFHSALAGSYLAMAIVLGLHRGAGMNPVVELRQQISAMVSGHVLVLMLSGLFGTLAGFEVAALVLSATASCVTLPTGRALLRKVLSRRSWWGESVLLVGTGDSWKSIAEFIRSYPQRGLKLAETMELDQALASRDPVEGAETGSGSRLNAAIRRTAPDWVMIAAPEREAPAIRRVVAECARVRNLVVLNGMAAIPTLWTRSYECAGLFGIHLRDSLLSRRMRFLKRLIDIVGALSIGGLALPLVLLAAGLIRWRSPGPIFYRHERIGRGGRRFQTLKFRTMVVDADRVLDDYLADHPELKEEWDRDRKLRSDPRMIRGIGRVLRMTSLDELPQLWNVLRGDMSLVGPRPIVAAEIPRYQSWYPLYAQVRPGLTGLWQVSGRNGTSYEDRVRLDAYYVMNWSPWMDAYVLLRTVRTVLWCEGAY